MYCEHCGNELKEGATRCNWCGTPVDFVIPHEEEQGDASQNVAQTEGEESKKKKRRWRRDK